MKQRSSRVLVALMATAALAFGGIGTASAQNGADDPPGHIVGGHGADDGTPASGADDNGRHHKGGKKGHKHGHGHGRHGADDGPNHT